MASRAKIDCEVFGGKRARKFKKGEAVDDDWYARKLPDLFEWVDAAKPTIGGKKLSRHEGGKN